MLNSCSQPDVSVIVVGLNASRYVQECFLSLESATWDGVTYEVIYVDNGSTDDTVPAVTSRFPAVKVIANKSNLGFCKAANQGAEAAGSRYLFFLNDDTLVLDDAVAALVRHAEQSSTAGAIGGRLLNTDCSEQYSGRRFPSPLNAVFGRRSFLTRVFPNAPAARDYCYKRELETGQAFRADWVSAAAVLFPAKVFRQIGGFAEDYYYWHEVVFCDRVRAAGFEVELLPAARIIHHEGKGSGARPFRVQRRHIKDFHWGAYRCYCEHFRLSSWHPTRAAVASVLLVRSIALLTAAAARSALSTARPAGMEAA
jgi:GT2 family glycosyltransferase